MEFYIFIKYRENNGLGEYNLSLTRAENKDLKSHLWFSAESAANILELHGYTYEGAEQAMDIAKTFRYLDCNIYCDRYRCNKLGRIRIR